VDALLFLLVAIVLTALSDRWPSAGLVAVPVAALAGTTLPDLDLMLGFGHRSGLTHSVLPLAVAAARPRWWPVAAGLALGIGLHLSADCFPNAMRGYATVKLPVVRSIGGWWSYLWLGVNALGCLMLGAWWLRRETTLAQSAGVLVAVVAVGVAYLVATDGGWPALIVFTGAGWAVTRRRG